MRSVPLVLLIVLLLGVAAGQETQPRPAARSVPRETEDVPTPTGTPEPQAAPDLLPESKQLPGQTIDLQLPSPSVLKMEGSGSPESSESIKLSPEEEERNRAKLAQLRTIAMRNPRVIELLKEANGALTDEAKREFMRAYYHTLCLRMRILQPGLVATINAFERVQIRKLASGPSHISIVSRDIARREKQRRARRSE